MTPPNRCLSKLVVLSAILIFLGIDDRAHGQLLETPLDVEVEPRADDRVGGLLEVERIEDTLMDPSNQTEGETLKEGGWDLGLVVSAAYDDNIFLSANNPQADLVFRITPRIAYVLGNAESEEGAYVRFDYRPTGVIYVENGNDSRIDESVSLAAGIQGEKTSVAFVGEYLRLGDAIPDTGTQTDRREYAVEIRAAYSVTSKVALEVAGGAYGTDYEVKSLSSTRDRFADLGIRYAYSPKTEVALIYRVGRAEVTNSGDQTFHRLTANMAWKPRQKISVNLEAGIEHRTFDLGSDNYPVVDLRVAWEAREGTDIYFGAYRREEVSAFLTGQNYSLAGVVAGISERLSETWIFRLEGGFEKTSYSRVSGTGPAGRRDNIYFIRPSLEHEIDDRFNLAFYYQFSQDRSNQSGFGYTDNQIGVSAGYDF
ncbi:hypothetical protein [Haloferula sp.]|uniref:hypothetical protein n=1 Tax=Haloferula sp. TaxID=2497595 RepID=UPI003C72D70B